MSPEQKRIKIAEACGTMRWSYALPKKVMGCGVPDYFSDLNAMATAEKTAFGSSTAWLEFAINLMRVLQCSEMSELDGMTCILQAAAAQRAEAFGLTLGLWKEGE